ncbi:LysR family transcriptional regulator [Motilimonas cestriensis]|uniref:LysR family transcriptional regulator n=1 Tax=Motilimonas cestriensis TaxID=2742685 RepID=A0ABS8W327_9GAMM|nr:LysR family transcriptional regulator [Motilimonas cestriensis]
MDTIVGINTIVAVVETGSFTAAAQRMDISKALVSKYVGQVEAQLGTRLFNRTTRQVVLTPVGQDYYQQALILLQHYQKMQASATHAQHQPQGKLRVTTSVIFGDTLLAPLLPTFLAMYPEVELDILLTNKKVDLLASGIDLAIRIGHLADSSLVAQKINQLPLMLCAAPEYLAKINPPKAVADLATLDCLIDSNHSQPHRWTLTDRDGKTESVNVKGRMTINSSSSIASLAIAGASIAMLPTFLAEPAINQGRLVRVLPEYNASTYGLYAVYPHRQFLSPKVRCFIDFIRTHFGQRDIRPDH